MKKVYVLIGNFGSGKTELSLNLAFNAAKRGKTLLIDLDMVNTYFRLTERKKLVEDAGIRLISPNYAMTNIETLSLPAEVQAAFDADWDTVVFDVGGDGAGATALGRYYADFCALPNGSLEVLEVVNVRRPLSGTAQKIIALTREIETSSRLSVTGLVNNTNLAHLTSPDELRDGYEILREVSVSTGIPVAYTSGQKDLLEAFIAEGHEPEYIGIPWEMTPQLDRSYFLLGKQK